MQLYSATVIRLNLCTPSLQFGQPHAYYGVFDGHAGIDAAVYSAALLHQYMIQNPQYPSNPEAALKHAFHITDTNFVKKAGKEVSVNYWRERYA